MGCGGARASRPDVRGAAADTVHLVRVLVSIAEFTTSTPAGWKQGGAHLEAIAAVTLQGDTAPQSTEHDTAPEQPLPTRAASLNPKQMRRAAASPPPAGSRWVPSPSQEGQRAPAPAHGWEQARG